MGDFPPEWQWQRDLEPGGQGHTFLVKRASGNDKREYVLKRLIKLSREDYFEREIRACETLNHINVLKVVEHGKTPKGRPFLITEYCAGGSLEKHRHAFDNPSSGLKFFYQIVDAVSHAHEHTPPVYHLDLKPANVFLKDGRPVVGDFGICYIQDDELAFTAEGQRGSRYYCAPELRNPRINPAVSLAAADMYSLGTVLYWLFTGSVYDGNEDDYGSPEYRLSTLYPNDPHFVFIDELISETVQKKAALRVASALDFKNHVREVIDRMDAGGHVLDLTLPQRCIFCAKGEYRVFSMPPSAAERNAPHDPTVLQSMKPDIYKNMRDQTTNALGTAAAGPGGQHSPVPIHLICNYCGNVQQFRLDHLAPEAMKNWKP